MENKKQYDFSDFDEPTTTSGAYDFSDFDESATEEAAQSAESIASQIIAPVLTTGVSEATRQAVASDTMGGFAEDLAFRAAGGTSTSQGTDLIKEAAISKGIGEVKDNVVEPTVNPRKVGREVLDNKLLGPFALGTQEGNLARATSAAIEASKPTNELLSSVDTPISKEAIFNRTQEILDAPNLDIAIPENKAILKNLDKRRDDFSGFYTPTEAEQTKRLLQKSVNYGSDKGAAKAAVSKAQARATRESTEAVLEAKGLLEEFKKLKSKSGNIQVAQDLLESSIRSQSPDLVTSATKAVGDVVTKKAPGMLAAGIDTAQKVAKSKIGRALPFLAGGAVSALSMAAEEGLDSEATGATPEMIEIDPNTGKEYAPYWLEKGIREPEEQVQKARLEGFKKDLTTGQSYSKMSGPYEKPEIKRYKEAVLEAEKQGTLRDNYVEKAPKKNAELMNDGKVTNVEGPELNALASQFESMPEDKAAQEYSRVLRSIMSSPSKNKEAQLAVLNQQPAFRELVRKSKGQK